MIHRCTAVIGTVCCDEIYHPGRHPVFGFGGLYYSLVTLAQLFDSTDSIYPVGKIGEQDFNSVADEFKKYPAVKMDRAEQYPGRNNKVILKYVSGAERREFSTHLPKPYTLDHLLPIPDAGLVILNFVSAIEMSYRTMRALKKRLHVPLFIDLHSIFLGFKRNGERYYRRNSDWSIWHRSGDILQMNSDEARLLAGDALADRSQLVAFGKHLVEKGASIILITDGIRGSVVIWKKGRRVHYKTIPAYFYGESLDPTGCGDVYSSAFAYRYLGGAEPPEAADFAGRVSGVRAVMRTSGELHTLRKIPHGKKLI